MLTHRSILRSRVLIGRHVSLLRLLSLPLLRLPVFLARRFTLRTSLFRWCRLLIVRLLRLMTHRALFSLMPTVLRITLPLAVCFPLFATFLPLWESLAIGLSLLTLLLRKSAAVTTTAL